MGDVSTEPRKVSQSEEQFAMLDNEVECLKKLVEVLRDRLNPVLRLMTEKNGGGVGVPAEPLAPIADYIRTKRAFVGNANQVLNDILTRLEI